MGADHEKQATPSAQNENHQQVPEPRVLACTACRKKKHLCDKRKPSCTPCLNVGKGCIYARPKTPKTTSELQAIARKLERKHVALLKTSKRKATSSRNASTQHPPTPQDQVEETLLEANVSMRSSSSNYLVESISSHCRVYQPGGPHGGYHFDESFLKMPLVINTASPQLSEISKSDQSEGPASQASLSPHDFIREPLTPSCHHQVQESPVLDKPGAHEGDVIEISSTSLTLSPQICRSPPPCSALDILKPTLDYTESYEKATPHQYQRSGRLLHNTVIAPTPSLRYSRATWWDHLLSTYAIFPEPSCTTISRPNATSEISRDVYKFFKSAPMWFTFVNIPLFFDTFHHVELRALIQPALVLSILAYAKLLQSIPGAGQGQTFEEGERTWKQSVVLRNLAQASFEASYNAGWIDLPLAQAAWILVLYEISSHRDCTLYRMDSSITLLDTVIRAIALTSIDDMDPRVPKFAAGTVPRLGRPPPNGSKHRSIRPAHNTTSTPVLASSVDADLRTALAQQRDYWRSFLNPLIQPLPEDNYVLGASPGCPCPALSLATTPEVLRSTPSLAHTPRWRPNASWAETRKEEARRLVWSSVVMLGCNAGARRAGGFPQLDLYIGKPENFALLYPGEEDYASLPNMNATYSGKESNWALWGRTMLLWLACTRPSSNDQPDTPLAGFSEACSRSDNETEGSHQSDYFTHAWMETAAIEEALNAHTCSTEQSMLYQTRDYLIQIRMQVSGGLRYSIPVVQTGVNFSHLDRDLGIQWLRHVHTAGLAILAAISGPDGSMGPRKMLNLPYAIFLSLGAVWRALELWKLDDSLSLALEVAVLFRRLFNWYQQAWPSAEVQRWAANAFHELDTIRGRSAKPVSMVTEN